MLEQRTCKVEEKVAVGGIGVRRGEKRPNSRGTEGKECYEIPIGVPPTGSADSPSPLFPCQRAQLKVHGDNGLLLEFPMKSRAVARSNSRREKIPPAPFEQTAKVILAAVGQPLAFGCQNTHGYPPDNANEH